MKLNPVSFNRAQRACVFWQEPACFSQTADAERGGAEGPRARCGGGSPASYAWPPIPVTAGTRTPDEHPRRAERSDLENAIMYF